MLCSASNAVDGRRKGGNMHYEQDDENSSVSAVTGPLSGST